MITLFDSIVLITIILSVVHGWRTGAIVSIVNLLSVPLGLILAVLFGRQIGVTLVEGGFPLIAGYALVFIGTILVLHFLAQALRGLLRRILVLGTLDEAAGAVLGFVKTWLLWLLFLILWHNVVQTAVDTTIASPTTKQWATQYDQTAGESTFGRLNRWVVPQRIT